MPNVVGGALGLIVNGKRLRLRLGNISYRVGDQPLRETMVGSDGVHGYKETPQACYIEAEITRGADVDLENEVFGVTDATVQLPLRDGTVVELRNAWYAGEGSVSVEESSVAVRFEGMSGSEVRP